MRAHAPTIPSLRKLVAKGEWKTHLRAQHLSVDVAVTKDNPYGQRFEINAPLATPSGRRIAIQSVWQIDKGAALPRLITLFPR